MEIEQPPVETHRDELPYRLKQQSLMAQLGRASLQESDFETLLQRATELCAQGLEAPYCKVLEYNASKNLLLLRAGVGWNPEDINNATLGADLESPAGFAFHMSESVLSNHLMAETRFRTPRLLSRYGIKRAVNVLIDLGGMDRGPYGILEVDSPDEGQFDEADVAFLSGCAGVLGAAIERHRSDQRLQIANDRLNMLMREMSHRVKNSLGVVSGLLRMSASTATDDATKAVLSDAEHRVMTVAHVHDHLWQGNKIGEIDLGTFVSDLCENLDSSIDNIKIRCEAQALNVNSDCAIPVGLIVNELVTNSMKYAYNENEQGVIDVSLQRAQGGIELSVSDHGKGLPADFDIKARRKSFGLRVVSSLLQQLNATIVVENPPRGSKFVLRFNP